MAVVPTRLALFASAALAFAGEALACSCLPPGTPQEEMAKPWSASVFRGRVLQVEPRGGLIERHHVSFAVSTVWQGPRDPLRLVSTATDSAACGYSFRVGEEYLVYEHEGGVMLCSRTRPASDAASDLALLGPGQPATPAPLSQVGRHAHLSGSWYNPARSGEGFVIETLGNDQGVVYWFGYDGDDPQRQAWMNGVGRFDGDQLHVAELQRPVGGGFGEAYRADQVQRPVWGSLTLTLPPDGDGEARFVPRNTPIPAAVTFPIRRLTRPPAPALPADLD